MNDKKETYFRGFLYRHGNWNGKPYWDYVIANQSLEEFEKNELHTSDIIVVATNKRASELLYQAKGENGKFIRKRFKDEKYYMLSASKAGLELIQKMGLEYLKNHPNEITVKEFRFLLYCLQRIDRLSHVKVCDDCEFKHHIEEEHGDFCMKKGKQRIWDEYAPCMYSEDEK